MHLQVRLRPEAAFIGSSDLRSEMLRRLAEAPVSIDELLSISGADIFSVRSLLDGLPNRLHEGLVVELADGTTI